MFRYFFQKPVDLSSLDFETLRCTLINIDQLPEYSVLNNIRDLCYFWTKEKLFYYNINSPGDEKIAEIYLTDSQVARLNELLVVQLQINSAGMGEDQLIKTLKDKILAYDSDRKSQLQIIKNITGHTPPRVLPNILFDYVVKENQDLGIIREICKQHPEYLISKAKDNNPYAAFGENTPLLWAIANSNIKQALVLLDDKIINKHWMTQQINMTDGAKTPLIFCTQKGWTHSCDRKIVSSFYSSPTQGQIAKRLLALRAAVNFQDKDGRTALHYAYLHRDIEAIKELCQYSADKCIKDKDGKNPMEMLTYSRDETKNFLGQVYTLLDEEQWQENENILRMEYELYPLLENESSILRSWWKSS